LPDALATLAACEEIAGRVETARDLMTAAQTLALAPRDDRAALLKRLRSDPDAGGLPLAALPTIRRLIDEGPAAAVQRNLGRIPRDLARLLSAPGITPLDVVHLHRRYGVVTAADIAAAATVSHAESTADEELRLRERLSALLPALRTDAPRIPLGHAWSIVETIQGAMDGEPGLDLDITPAGSVRRFEPTVGDIEVILRTDTPAEALDRVLQAIDPGEVTHRGPRIATALVRGEQVTLRAVPPAEHPAALAYFTGSAGHVQQLQARAAARGWTLGPTGLTDATARRHQPPDEAALYAELGLPFIPPELRHGLDEIDAAVRGDQPDLLNLGHIRGDLHTHTLWSDGRDSVEAVAWAARALGFTYVAITDHSPSAAASRVLTLDRLARQADDVLSARERVPDITILHGVEVDILPNGRLDLPDEVMERLDIVLASLHESAGHGPERLLERYLAAIRHPLVNVVTHPANRLVGRHDGYAIDFDALFAAAAQTGTAVEVDGGPAHLDLDGHLARRAAAAGATLVVDSDCHNVTRLARQMRLAVGTARRGAIEPRHVLNTGGIDVVRAFVARKRSSR
jgi:DNA polymerase (family 10)